MKKTLVVMIFTSLLMYSVFVSSVIAEDVTITIKGGFGCTVTIRNNGNSTINASIIINSSRIFREGGTNSTGHGLIKPGESISATSYPPGIESIYSQAQAENQTLVRKGISIFYFVLLFR